MIKIVKMLFNGLLGYFLCWFGACFVFMDVGLRQGGSRSGSILMGLAAAIFAVPCGRLGRTAIIAGKRFLRANHLVESVDQVVPFVVYLRSFKADGEYAVAESSTGGAGPAVTAEEDLALALGTIAKPIVAIGRPGEWLPELGADRYYVGQEDWQSIVLGLLARTKFVVIQMGGTAGLQWELAECVRNLSPEQLVLWLPNSPAADEPHRMQRAARYRGFLAWARSVIPGLPDELGDAQFISFEARWTPRIIPKYQQTTRDFFLAVPTVIPSIFVQTSQHARIRNELLLALGRPVPRPSWAAFLIKGPLVVISSALLFVVLYLSGIALALAVLVGIYLVCVKLFGG